MLICWFGAHDFPTLIGIFNVTVSHELNVFNAISVCYCCCHFRSTFFGYLGKTKTEKLIRYEEMEHDTNSAINSLKKQQI